MLVRAAPIEAPRPAIDFARLGEVFLSLDGINGWCGDGEIQVHDRPPFAPDKRTVSVSVVFRPPARFGRLCSTMRLMMSAGVPFEAVVAKKNQAILSTDWHLMGVVDEWATQRIGWSSTRTSVVRDGDGTLRRIELPSSRPVPIYRHTGDGAPIYALTTVYYREVRGFMRLYLPEEA